MDHAELRIGHIARELGVEQFVIRFWEKEFGITPQRSHGGQRCYTPQDLELLRNIKELLHDKRFTIAGAKQALLTQKFTPSVSSELDQELPQGLKQQLITVKNQLEKVRDQL